MAKIVSDLLISDQRVNRIPGKSADFGSCEGLHNKTNRQGPEQPAGYGPDPEPRVLDGVPERLHEAAVRVKAPQPSCDSIGRQLAASVVTCHLFIK